MFGKKKPKVITKHTSIAFWLSIPCTFFLGSVLLITSYTLTSQYFFDNEKWALFLIGFLGGIVALAILPLTRTRVFLHELKHALMVVVSGGKLKGFLVRKDSGLVTYEISEKHASAGPAITLAPYCFPMLSLPVLLAAVILQDGRQLLFSALLGFTLGIDLSMCLGEVRPVQTDFKAVMGGFLFSALYIGGWLYCWTNLCLLWVVGGRDAMWYAGGVAVHLLSRMIPDVTKGR